MHPHHHAAPQRQAQPLAAPGPLRVTGRLVADAQIYPSTQRHGALLVLTLQPEHGLPYEARIDLGTDVAEHMAAEQMLPQLVRGAVMSVAAEGMDLRHDHGHAVLRLHRPHSAVLFEHPIHTP